MSWQRASASDPCLTAAGGCQGSADPVALGKTCQKNDWEMMLGVFLIVACRVGRRAVHLDTNSAALCAPQTRTLTGVSFLMLLSDLYHHLKLLTGVTFLESLQNGLSALYDPGKRHISLYD